MRPERDTRPYVGFKPTTPQKCAGWRIEPPVSVPSAATHSRAATAAAEPPDEPPGTRCVSAGLHVGCVHACGSAAGGEHYASAACNLAWHMP
eukprot:355515-Chlamydomonas_euryale.AAC.13